MQGGDWLVSATGKRLFFIPQITTEAGITENQAVLKALLLGHSQSISDTALATLFAGHDTLLPPATLLQIAQHSGLTIEQALLPGDALQLTNALPVLVLLRPISEEPPHWAVVWNRVGPFYQVMDPQLGRLWMGRTQLLSELGSEDLFLTADAWRALSTTATSRQFLRERVLALQPGANEADALLTAAYAPDHGYGPAVFDAALRTVERMVEQGALRRGRAAVQVLQRTFAQAEQTLVEQGQLLAPVNWVVQPDTSVTPLALAPARLHGIVGLRVVGLTAPATAQESSAPSAEPGSETAEATGTTADAAQPAKQSVLTYLREEGLLSPALIAVAMLFAGAGMFFQAILFRSLAELSLRLQSMEERLWAIALLLAFTLTLMGLKWVSHSAILKLGHRLDGRLRLAVLAQLPRLSNSYFQQIPAGDMIERIHQVRAVRKLPFYASELVYIAVQFLMTVVGLFLLDWLSALLTFIKLLLPFATMYISGYIGSEAQRTRIYLGFLSRFYLDAMQGLVAIRTHGAEQATRREYEALLGKWVQSNINVYLGEWWFNTIGTALSYGMTALVIFLYVVRDRDPANLLLLTYWSVNLESLRGPLIFLTISYLFDQWKATRFLQLLEAPTEEALAPKGDNGAAATVIAAEGEQAAKPRQHGIEIVLQGVQVEAAEQVILQKTDLTIAAGSQIGIVGPSGAGKSTLVGLLLGWHYPATGQVLLDGESLDYARLQQLRNEVAWVDPTIQLWNRSFLYNLRYGGGQMPLNWIIEQADLRSVLERLPDGMQTRLGGEGRLISGGEGQRTRFGRGLQRQDARLVILDEPFRGLDREKRRLLLTRAREYWPTATLICVTHDVGQTQSFERVLVVENGRIIEDDTPAALLARPVSRYKALLDAEDAVREKLWANEAWRRLWLENGQVREAA
ncbi:MAG: ABC transporter ATP-binding protein [Caldilinea sp. CFX5]|nr:ABC transporter ATP-binding protein [Caldilinea sp. CFX5]